MTDTVTAPSHFSAEFPTAQLQVRLVGVTRFLPPPPEEISGWTPEGDRAQDLIEFGGRACYQSWTRPNPRTATNAGYIDHILEVGHGSVLEHSQASFYLTGVSRSLTHELIRHRHLSVSQLSQRFVPAAGARFVVPEVIAEDPTACAEFESSARRAELAYDVILDRMTERYAHVENPTKRRKLARQAARSVMPNATETRILVTGNYRAWRHFIVERATEHADVEIRALALSVLVHLADRDVAHPVFADFVLSSSADGELIAATRYQAPQP